MSYKFQGLLIGLAMSMPSLFAQNISRQIYGAGGNFCSPFRSFVQLEYNIGEPLITTVGDNTVTITQGFIQPSVPLIFPPPFGGIKFSFAPNPTTNFIGIKSDKEIIADIRIMDMNNHVLREFHNVKLGPVYYVDVSKLLPGAYLIIISNNNGIIVQKFIKQ